MGFVESRGQLKTSLREPRLHRAGAVKMQVEGRSQNAGRGAVRVQVEGRSARAGAVKMGENKPQRVRENLKQLQESAAQLGSRYGLDTQGIVPGYPGHTNGAAAAPGPPPSYPGPYF